VTREYDKLVRDGIPAIIEDDGETPVVHTASGDEFEQRLEEKLDEEVAEYRESGTSRSWRIYWRSSTPSENSTASLSRNYGRCASGKPTNAVDLTTELFWSAWKSRCGATVQ